MIFHILFRFALLCTVNGYQMCLHGTTLQVILQDVLPTSVSLSLTEQSDLSYCALNCTYRPSCVSFFYNSNLKSCSLHASNLTLLQMVGALGWTGYEIPDGARMYISDQSYTSTTSDTVTTATSLTTTGETTTSSETVSTSATTSVTPETSTVTTTSTVSTTPPSSTTVLSTTIESTTTSLQSFWVDNVVDFSSQFRQIGWSANQVLGEPDVYPSYGDYEQAWASLEWTGIEWIQVQIASPVMLQEVAIYETFHAGGVTEVAVLDTSDQWEVIWTTPGISVIEQSRIFTPTISIPTYPVDIIRIETDCSLANHWVEIDAIKVTGYI